MSSERKFRNVAVLKGGPSAERKISLRSGAAVAQGLREAGYTVLEVDLKGYSLDLPAGIEAVFIALHGEFGEDGQVQALLERRRIPYTGSGPEASAAALDKVRSKEVFAKSGIPTPEYEVIGRGDKVRLPLPVVLKPPRQGSSIGVHRVFRREDLDAALSDAFSYDGHALVEKFIDGRELTVGVVGTEVLPVIEIVVPGGWYHYDAKYTSGDTQYLVPAPIGDALTRKCRDAAWRAFEALGCRGFGRIDIMMTPNGDVYVLELNSIPGFTATSLLPKAAKQAGIGFSELCHRILDMASTRAG